MKNELRIGNFIRLIMYAYDELDTHNEITGLDEENPSCNTITFDYLDYDDLEPIPLNEEWLLKFGFNDATGGWGGSQGSERFYEKGIVEIQTYDSDDKWHLKGQFEVKFKYVHQLQNLYFALCGEELEINLKHVEPQQ